MKKGKIDFFRIIVLLFVLAIIVWEYMYLFNPKDLPPLLKIGTFEKDFSMLVAGVDVTINADTREKNYSFGRSDTMLLLKFNSKKEKLSILSIPRDCYVSIPQYGKNKINVAFVLGGIDFTKEIIEDIIDRKIDRYLILNTQNIIKLVDLLGGVDIYIPEDMKYADRAQGLHIDLKKGWQHLDGKKAGDFLRYRENFTGDIGRIERQQIFMKVLFSKLCTPTMIFKAPFIVNTFIESVKTNLSQKEFIVMINTLRMMKGENINSYLLPGEVDYIRGVGSIWKIDKKALGELISQDF